MSSDAPDAGVMRRKLEIRNQYGIHARPAAMIVKIANRHQAEVTIEKDGYRVSGKSIMGLMTLEASCGTKLIVEASGDDAEQVLDELEALVDRKFDEE